MHSSLLTNIKAASLRLRKKLIELPVSSIGISDYNQKYLLNKIKNIDAILHINCKILYLSLKNSSVPFNDFALIDYGGGSGIFSLLAKEVGIGTVIYNDIYDISCEDIHKISEHINIPIQHIVCGDIEELIHYVQKKAISIHAIASFDVIEHIYDIESHFQKLATFQNTPFQLIYGSGANIENFWKVRSMIKGQISDELSFRQKSWGHKERDILESYLEVRKKIISDYAPEMNASNVDYLAKRTRGLIQADIERYTNEFLSTGDISYRICHSTNTCDPLTGNWSEHLMDLHWMKKKLEQTGFNAKIIPGYYEPNGSILKKSIQYTLNFLIFLLKRRGMLFAPYYIVVAK